MSSILFSELGEVFVVAGEVKRVVADRRVVFGGQLAVAVVVAIVGNSPVAVVVSVFSRALNRYVIENKAL